jgi:bacterioferritin
MASTEDDERLVDLLQQARNDELETVINYQTNALALSGVEAQEIVDSLSTDVQEELDHAKEIGERIGVLGGKPRGSYDIEMSQESLQPPAEATDVLTVVEGVIEAEGDAVSTYEALVDAAEEADDPVTEDLATELLADEQEHLAEFKGFREGLLDE